MLRLDEGIRLLVIVPRSIASSRDVARHYDGLDVFYRGVWGEHLHHGYWARGDESAGEAVSALVDLVARSASLNAHDRVCDVGCGYGATAAHLSTRFGARVTGITLSEQQFVYAVDRYADENCSFSLGDWLANKLEAHSFEVVTAIECLSHMADKARFFEEAHRVLVPGGRLVVCAWLAGDAVTERQVRWLLEPICREGRLPSMCDEKETTRLALEAGFEAIDSNMISRSVRRTWTICLRRLAGRLLMDGRYRRYLLDSRNTDRAFLKSIGRIIIAYRTGAMAYGMFVFRKPR